MRAIAGLSMGTIDKIHVRFAEPFWPAGWKGFNVLWTHADRAALPLQDAWLADVMGLYPVDNQPAVMFCWITGRQARHMEELSGQEVCAGIMRLLRQFGTKAVEGQVPQPVEVCRSQWHRNAYFRGSISNRSMVTEESKNGWAELAEPVWRCDLVEGQSVPVLQFAGEATHERFFASVHGAVETGRREADRLIELYGEH